MLSPFKPKPNEPTARNRTMTAGLNGTILRFTHCKLGQSTLVVLCAGSTLLLVQSYAPDKAPYINCLERSLSQLASTFRSWFFLLLVRLNLGFILREDLLLCSSYLPLGVPNWVPTTHYQPIFLAPLPGRKRISARGVSHFQSFYLVIVLLYFIFSCIFLSKIQKN
jgi:hypothetical protein